MLQFKKGGETNDMKLIVLTDDDDSLNEIEDNIRDKRRIGTIIRPRKNSFVTADSKTRGSLISSGAISSRGGSMFERDTFMILQKKLSFPVPRQNNGKSGNRI